MARAPKSSHNPPAKASSRKPTLSPTRIGVFLECAVKYRYIYIEKLARFYQKARAGYSFGSTLHHVLQDFHEGGGVHSPEEMVDALEQSWIGAGYESAEQEQERRTEGEQIVAAYHAAHQERVEQAVETVATEKTITFDMGAFKLQGRVDRIDRHTDGTLEIIDYKSGRLETSPEQVANSLAMTIYQLILKRLHPEAIVCATIYCLRSGNTATYAMPPDAMDEFETELRALADEILTTEYETLIPVPVPACPDCDFLPRCERFWREHARREQRAARLDEPGWDETDRTPSDMSETRTDNMVSWHSGEEFPSV